MIVAFLAVLEMVKLQAVGLAQEKQFGEIVVKKGKSFDVIFDEAGGIKQIDEEYNSEEWRRIVSRKRREIQVGMTVS